MELLFEHLAKGFFDMLLITMPVVLTAAAIGLVIGILQAVTQVQEQTISAAPKILGVFLVILLMGGFFTKILTDYLRESIYLACEVVPKQETFVLPPKDYRSENRVETKKVRKIRKKVTRQPASIDYSSQGNRIRHERTTNVNSPNVVEQIKINGK